MKQLLLILLLAVGKMFSQDIRGALMRTEWVTATSYIYNYKITVDLFIAHGTNVDRPSIQIAFGDGTSGPLPLINTTSDSEVDIKTYSGTHLYSGPTSNATFYPVAYRDSFRVEGIANMPSSETQEIFLLSRIFANSVSWMNNSVQITNLPNNLSVEGDRVMYNPACVDAESDSLAFSLINCNADQYYIPGNAVANYSTGIVSVSKDSIGLYALCLQIKEFQKNTDNEYQYAHTTWYDFTLDITTTVGIPGLAANKLLQIGPNPVTDHLTVRALDKQLNIKNISIENSLGQRIFEQNTLPEDQRLDLSFLPDGIYFLKMETNQGSVLRKVIKN